MQNDTISSYFNFHMMSCCHNIFLLLQVRGSRQMPWNFLLLLAHVAKTYITVLKNRKYLTFCIIDSIQCSPQKSTQKTHVIEHIAIQPFYISLLYISTSPKDFTIFLAIERGICLRLYKTGKSTVCLTI